MISQRRASLLLALLLATSALAQDERPSVSIPQPKRQRSTPTPDSPLTIVQVSYKYAIKERDYLSMAAQELVKYTRTSTHLEVPLHSQVLTLDDPRIADALMLYMTGFDCVMRIDEQEKKGLSHYLRSGGLLFAEDILPLESNLRGEAGVAGTPFDQQFKTLLKDPQVLGSRGGHWRKLPKNDPLYSAYFDFLDGPPLSGTNRGNVFALEAIELKGRLAVIFSDLNISWFWANRDAEGRERSLQFGTNLLICALAQKYAGQPLPFRR